MHGQAARHCSCWRRQLHLPIGSCATSVSFFGSKEHTIENGSTQLPRAFQVWLDRAAGAVLAVGFGSARITPGEGLEWFSRGCHA